MNKIKLMKMDRSFSVCLVVLLLVLAGLQFAGHRALARDYIRIDVHDEFFYLKNAQADYMQIHEHGVFGYLWETLHTFKSRTMLAKEPGTRLVSAPVILLAGGVKPDTLRYFSYCWLIPATLFLYFGLTLLIRPVPALAGALFFCLSQCTLGTFLHWYQEITAIPAICALILAVIYESRYGSRDDRGWLFTGAVVGAGLLTKVSFVFIALWMCGLLFVLSGRLDNPRIRRARLFKAGLLAYIPASFWWSAHFPYVLSYVCAGAPAVMMQGTLEPGAERFIMFLRTQFSYMYGFWNSLLLLVAVCIAVVFLIDKVRRHKFQLNQVVVVFLAVSVPLLAIYIKIYRGNCFNPRIFSVIIPLAAAVFAIVTDRVGQERKTIQAVVFSILLFQGISIFVPAIRPDWKQDKRWVQPFHKTPVNPADYSRLPSIAPLPANGCNLRIGYAGMGLTFSPHILAWGYYPDVQRIEPVSLVSVNPGNIEGGAVAGNGGCAGESPGSGHCCDRASGNLL